MHVKKGDKVIILAGKDKGKSGEILTAFPKRDKVIVSGLNIFKKHQRPTKSGQKGQVVDRAMPIHISNVCLADAAPKPKKKAAK